MKPNDQQSPGVTGNETFSAGRVLRATTVPKRGGVTRGIGEKFAPNRVSGTGSMSVPLPVSPGRSGFGPQLKLSYDWGLGNGGSTGSSPSCRSPASLTDRVRIRNGEVCYWPSVGYGHFGPKITMDNAPWFDHVDQFSEMHVRLADIDGSHTADILYLGQDGGRVYFNQSGDRLSAPRARSVATTSGRYEIAHCITPRGVAVVLDSVRSWMLVSL